MSTEQIQLHGVDLIYRSGTNVWVACLGPDYFVHFSQPTSNNWQAKKPFALEPIAYGKTLSLCLSNSMRHYEHLRAEIRERVARKIADPIVQRTFLQKPLT